MKEKKVLWWLGGGGAVLGAAKPVGDDKLHTFPHVFVVFVRDVETAYR